MKRYILTGTPGAGKTSILHGLRDRGYDVVEEAATDIIARDQERGVTEPWTDPSFIDAIVTLQRERQQERPRELQRELQQHSRQRELPQRQPARHLEIYDRSPVCTHALSAHLGYPISATLAAELDRIERERIYERRVFFVRNLGFCEPTAARRISFEDSLEFERVHAESYRDLGFELVDVPAADLGERVGLVAGLIEEFAEGRRP